MEIDSDVTASCSDASAGWKARSAVSRTCSPKDGSVAAS